MRSTECSLVLKNNCQQLRKNDFFELDILYGPGTPLHEVAGISEGVDEQKEGVPETDTRKHSHKVQIPVFADVVDY